MSKRDKILWMFAVIGVLSLLVRGWFIALVVIPLGLCAVFFDELCELGGALWDRFFT